jgi:hypothetical protein
VNIRTRTRFLSAFTLVLGFVAHAQTLPNAPSKPPAVSPDIGSYSYAYQFGLACGAGASYSSIATKPTVQCGGLTICPLMEFEAGVMGPQATQSLVSGYLTANVWAPLGHPGSKHGVPIVTGGYTRMFETGHALDYGVGYAYPIDGSHSIRLDARDYWTFTNPTQHNVLLRVVWLVGIPD